MERHNGIEPDPEGAFVYYADAQATVEALQGILDIGKRDMTNTKYDGYFEAAEAALRQRASGSPPTRRRQEL